MGFNLKDRLRAALRLAPCVVLVFLVVLFCAHWIVLAHYAIDIPLLDDWRAYDAGDAGSLALSRLMVSSNDTLYPVGKSLDALNFRLFAGDNVVYQIISFAGVIGGLLLLQYALLKRYAPSATALGVAALSLVFMLQPRSYWGAQSLAYHQALPLIALLGGLLVAVASRLAIGAKVALITLITMLGGLAYISGAFAAAAIALFALAFWWRLGPGREEAYRAATLGFGLGAALSLPAQLWVILVIQHGQTHRADAPWCSPLTSEFWQFIAGIVGRAIGFSGSVSVLAFVASLIVALASLVLLLILLRPLASRTTDPDDGQFAFVYGAICAAILVFLGMVAAARTNFGSGDVEQTPLGLFQLGEARFYFFWMTILIPWMVLAILRLANGPSRTVRIAVAASLAMLLLIDFAGNRNTIFGLVPYYRSLAELKEKGLKCLAAKIQGEPPYLCADLYPADLAGALDDADLIGAKFMRYLPPFRGDTWHYQPLWEMQASTAATMAVVNGAAEKEDAGLRIVANNDPQVMIDLTDASAAMQACHRLRIRLELSRDAAIGDPVQLFYLATGKRRFNEAYSALEFPQAAEGDAANIEFNVKSLTGFAPRLRLDPARGQGVSVIRTLEVACAQ